MGKGDSLRTLSKYPGEKLSAQKHHDLLRRVAQMQGETVRGPRRGSSSVLKPFTMMLSLDGAGPNYNLLLWPGTVNQLVPANMFTPITYDPTTVRYVKLEVTTDGYKPTGVDIVAEAGSTGAIGSTADTAPTTFEILIGVLNENVRYQTWQSGNITVAPALGITAGKAVPVPGTSPYTYYYSWSIDGDNP